MSDAWAVVVAALGAAFLSTFGALVLDWNRSRQAERATRMEARTRAYAEVSSRSALLAARAADFRLLMTTRSGAADTLSVAMGLRDPIGALDISDLLRRDTEPLFRAVADVAVIGSPEAVETTQRILDAASDLIATSTRRGEEGGRASRSVRGDRWTPEQDEALAEAQRQLERARSALTDLARAELGADSLGA